MADYYPLIARAIAGLDPSAPGESRRALYERARTALIAQLRSVEPPLSESEITRERLSLEEAVRKVESEAAQRARDATRSGGGDAARSGARAGDAFRANNRSGTRPSAPHATIAPPLARRESRRATIAPIDLRHRGCHPVPIVADADRQVVNARRRAAAAGMTTRHRRRACAGFAISRPTLTILDAPQRKPTAQRGKPMPTCRRRRRSSTGSSRAWRIAAAIRRRPIPTTNSIEEAERYTSPASPPRSRLSLHRGRDPKKRPRTAAMFPFKSAIAIGVVLILVGAAILMGKQVVNTVSGLFKPSSDVVEAPKDSTAPLAKPKIPDRVGQPSSTEQVAPVAQRVVLYDEDPSDPKGKQYVGTVVWRTEPIKGGAGQAADIAVRADIDIPDRKFKMTMSFRRNTDTSLPASHTAELTFMLPPDFSGGGVSNVPGILMKSNEQARGTPLAGLAVKVTDGFFLVGLSNVESDRSRNIQLLKERSWFDVPLVYVNQRRAIIAIEKGAPGERAFNDAFAAWGE